MGTPGRLGVTVTFAGSGDAFGSGGRYQACIHLRGRNDQVIGWEVAHPSGALALALRLEMGGRVIAYSGDTAWTDVLLEVADGADLFIAEAYRMDKLIPHHLRHADLATRRDVLTSSRIVLTHMGPDVLARRDEVLFEIARDGLVLDV